MKHVKSMTRSELLAAMKPEAAFQFINLSPAEQEAEVNRIAEAQDRLHTAAVTSSWFQTGQFYE